MSNVIDIGSLHNFNFTKYLSDLPSYDTLIREIVRGYTCACVIPKLHPLLRETLFIVVFLLRSYYSGD